MTYILSAILAGLLLKALFAWRRLRAEVRTMDEGDLENLNFWEIQQGNYQSIYRRELDRRAALSLDQKDH